jgi:predicted  nucleic acid-binding Zn-ribbon protein
MTKDELREKRKRAIESLNDVKALLGLDELYIDELEKDSADLKEEVNKIAFTRGNLEEENAEAKNLIEELASSLSVVGECDEEECELINKAQKFINKPIF